MASLERDPASRRYRVRFRLQGVAHKSSLKTTDEREARAAVERIEETLRLIERGRIEVPPEADPAIFVVSDGKRTQKAVPPKIRTLGALFKAYRESLPPGTKEVSTLEAEDRHMKHLARHLKRNCMVQSLTVSQMQGYVERRSHDKWRKRPISPDTIQKELATFRYIWNWGVLHGHLIGRAPIKGINLPKTDEKLPFMAWNEIAQRIERDNLDECSQKELWDCLFLRTTEIDELLRHVKSVALHPFVYPMFVMAAHTGARRSEILRSEVDDFEFHSRTAVLREKKKSRKKGVTFRRVPMTDLLDEVMRAWIGTRKCGKWTFARSELPLANRGHDDDGPLSGSQASDHFDQTLSLSKWSKVRGFHVFRHSFASNCAAMGLDQRIIDEWMGHQTEEMRRRYRHLFPDQQRAAIDSVFAGNGK